MRSTRSALWKFCDSGMELNVLLHLCWIALLVVTFRCRTFIKFLPDFHRRGSVVAEMSVAVSLKKTNDEKTATEYVKAKLAESLVGSRVTLGNLAVKGLQIRGT